MNPEEYLAIGKVVIVLGDIKSPHNIVFTVLTPRVPDSRWQRCDMCNRKTKNHISFYTSLGGTISPDTLCSAECAIKAVVEIAYLSHEQVTFNVETYIAGYSCDPRQWSIDESKEFTEQELGLLIPSMVKWGEA